LIKVRKGCESEWLDRFAAGCERLVRLRIMVGFLIAQLVPAFSRFEIAGGGKSVKRGANGSVFERSCWKNAPNIPKIANV
jgi:hypothetical protein